MKKEKDPMIETDRGEKGERPLHDSVVGHVVLNSNTDHKSTDLRVWFDSYYICGTPEKGYSSNTKGERLTV